MDTSIYPFVLLAIYDQEINHHYLRRYIKLIRHYKAIEPQGKRKKGFERHHIFPKNYCSKQFAKDSNNLVLLPLRAHFIAHWMLYKAFPKNREMILAFSMFLFGTGRNESKITSRVFEKLKQDFSDSQKGKPSGMNGKRHSAETKQKMSKAQKDNTRRMDGSNNPMFGKPSWNRGKTGVYSEETLKRKSEATKGRPLSEAHKQALRKPKINKQKPKQCPHCGKVCSINNYSRYHGEQCQQNPDNKQ